MKQLRELYEYREMIFSLVKKDLRGRYKGSVLGFLWTFINPLLQLVVFTLVFSVIMKAGYEQYYMFLFVVFCFQCTGRFNEHFKGKGYGQKNLFPA